MKSFRKHKLNEIQFSYCHRMPERSFFWKGKQFPVCARCTGIHIGYLSLPLFLFSLISISMFWTILLIIPTYLDGLTQALFKRESTNFIRVTTGILAGIGSMSLISIIGKNIGYQIVELVHNYL